AVVVSGEPTALDELLASCEADEVRARRGAGGLAPHSPQGGVVGGGVLKLPAPPQPQPAQGAVLSTLEGAGVEGPRPDAADCVTHL
ncbi:hypothetical protein, partial [Streptomyces sp. RTd22]|uniref:hypothetical protein n=1 Tax=Streptomyces sp. RTd22 TaxID=1841249 RepID=UPI001F1D8EB5